MKGSADGLASPTTPQFPSLQSPKRKQAPSTETAKSPPSPIKLPTIMSNSSYASPPPPSVLTSPLPITNPKNNSSIESGAIIHFRTHSVEVDLLSPWKSEKSDSSTGTGFYIGNRYILTNCHVVQNASSIRLERNGQPGNFDGEILCQSELLDLALVTVRDDSFWSHLPPCKLDPEIPLLGDAVFAVGYPLGAESITITRGVVSNVQMLDLSLRSTNPRSLCVQIDAAINPGNSGGPVFNIETGNVVGVAFAGKMDAEGCGYIIPVPVINQFLKAYEKDGRRNFGLLPELGITRRDLYNETLRRKHFRVERVEDIGHRDGQLVVNVDPFGCSAGIIKAGDILVELDGLRVSEKGEVRFRGNEWLPAAYTVSQRACGDVLKMKVLRLVDDVLKELQLEVKLAPTQTLIPRVLNVDYAPTWVIAGGLVFLTASDPVQDYMSRIMAVEAAFEFEKFRECKRQAADEEIVFLSGVLAHSINVSFAESFLFKRLYFVNGVPVRNMRHLALALHAIKQGLPIPTLDMAPLHRGPASVSPFSLKISPDDGRQRRERKPRKPQSSAAPSLSPSPSASSLSSAVPSSPSSAPVSPASKSPYHLVPVNSPAASPSTKPNLPARRGKGGNNLASPTASSSAAVTSRTYSEHSRSSSPVPTVYLELGFKKENPGEDVAVFDIDEVKRFELKILNQHVVSGWCSQPLLF